MDVDFMEYPIISDKCDMSIFKKTRVTLFTGAFGSGKTELSANFAAKLSGEGKDTTLVDIDIVKPMFRSRELKTEMANRKVKLVSTLAHLEMADLPALSPQIFSSIESDDAQVVIDVGGDDDGARVIGRLSEKLSRSGYEMLYVINTKRPFTTNLDQIMYMIESVKQACRLEITSLVANTNLGAESSLQIAQEGLSLVKEVSKLTNIPIRFIALHRELLKDEDDIKELSKLEKLPVFMMDRFMLPPWEKEKL